MTRTQMGDTRRTQMGAEPQVKPGLTSLDRPRYSRPAGRRHSRRRELAQLDQLMRQPGTLTSEPAPIPLHKMGSTQGGGPGDGKRAFLTPVAVRILFTIGDFPDERELRA
jgi:hypothetical protein